jgi:hypothetical protein
MKEILLEIIIIEKNWEPNLYAYNIMLWGYVTS